MVASVQSSRFRDVFISHASEDKDAIARPLADELIRRGRSVWFDEYELLLGDPLRRSIDEGLACSTIGVVILSHAFFAKDWPQLELDGLYARVTAGEKNVIVPIWHDLGKADLLRYSPLLTDLVGGKAADGVERLADEIERVLSRHSGTATKRKRRRRFSRNISPVTSEDRVEAPAAIPANRVLSLPKEEIRSTPARPRAESAEELAERAVRSLGKQSSEIPVTIAGGSRLIAELSRRSDGVMTIRSRYLSPQQRVLPADSETKIRELTISALKRLTPLALAEAEVHSSPEASTELPPRLLASEEQMEMAQTLAAALKAGVDRRLITLREDRGLLSLRRSGQTVKVSTSHSQRSSHASSCLAGDANLAEHVLAGITAISRRKTFGEGRLEDSFPLTEMPSYSRLRMLTEQLIRAGGQFSLWQKAPIERFVLKARRSRDGALVLECPGSVPSVQQFEVSGMMAFVEALERAMSELLAQSGPLEVFAVGLLADLLPSTRLTSPSSSAASGARRFRWAPSPSP